MTLSLKQCLDAFIEDCRSCDYNLGTLAGYRKDINIFIKWAWHQNCLTPSDVTPDLLEAYQQYLMNYRTRYNTPLKASTRKTYLMRLKALLNWLSKQGIIEYSPSESIILPKMVVTLPKVLSVAEMERLLASVDVHSPYGVRDKAILETLYSTGIRSIEAANLTPDNIDFDSGWVMIRQGKFKKDRRIPIGDTAMNWLTQYLNYERPKSKRSKQYTQVFLSVQSHPFTAKGVSALVSRYLKQSGLRKQGGSHLIRHTMASHMLQNGADIRYIQQMLGHSSLSSTQIYTQVQDRDLKTEHRAKHPAKLINENKLN